MKGRKIFLSDFYDENCFKLALGQPGSLLLQVHSIWEKDLRWAHPAGYENADPDLGEKKSRVFLREELIDEGLYLKSWEDFQKEAEAQSAQHRCFYFAVHEQTPVAALKQIWNL